MSKAAICVVVPVYKAMATLDRCVESVLAQQAPVWPSSESPMSASLP